MIPTTFTFLNIGQWVAANPDLKEEQEECMSCYGTGDHTCECGDEHECCSCDGTGFTEGSSYFDLYKIQLERDIERLSKYLEINNGEEANLALTSLEETKKKLILDARDWHPKK